MSSKGTKKKLVNAKKTSSRTTSVQTHNPSQYKALIDDIRPLLEGIWQPSSSAIKLAHNTISKIILEKSSDKGLTKSEQIQSLLSFHISSNTLKGYATLDAQLINQINSFISTIEIYIKDSSQQRPLNFMMLASPGAGKSHFIKCVASALSTQSISAITFNMASMQSNEDLTPSIDAARNLKVEDRLPLLFLDEFDSSPSNYSLLLPLMWDGGLNIGQRDLKLGKVIIVLAGSDPKLPETMEYARSMREQSQLTPNQNPKLVDLFSRVNGGVLKIPPFYDLSHKTDRRVDKICITIHLLRTRFGSTLKKIPLGLLKFISETEFRYDVRSIAHLIDLIPFQTAIRELTFDQLSLPLKSAQQLKRSSLIYHLIHEDQALGIVNKWKEAISVTSPLLIDVDTVAYFESMKGWPNSFLETYISNIIPQIGL